MRKLFIIILVLTLTASLDAQVSVRRTSKKDTTSSAKTPRSTSRTAAKTQEKHTPTLRDTETTDKTTPVVEAAHEATPVRKATVEKKTTTRREAPSQVDNASLRRKLFDEMQPQPTNDARWQHVIYRELDLEDDANAALYYPQEPVDGLTNFFQILFEAMLKGQLKAYEYLDGREVFSDKYLVDVKQVLRTHEIYYDSVPGKNGQYTYVVDQSEIPTNLVKSYYIKEKWEVDKNTSQFRPHIVAICPILHKPGYSDSSISHYPLFWIDFNDLRPFINAQLIMTAEMNTAHRYTMDDFFTLGLYKGEIFKVQNPRGLTLMQQYPDTAQLRQKREEIEAQLRTFGKSVYPEEPEQAEEPAKKAEPKKADDAVEREERAVVADQLVKSDEAEGKQTKGWNIGKTNRRTKKAVEQTSGTEDEDTSYYSVRRLK